MGKERGKERDREVMDHMLLIFNLELNSTHSSLTLTRERLNAITLILLLVHFLFAS
jgi:hypothetical protein